MHASIADFVMPEPGHVEEVVDRLRLLSDGTRLRILFALAQGESNPTCLAELAGVGVPAVSQHLAKLRLAGVVRPHRAGQQVWYELVDSAVRELVTQLLATPGASTAAVSAGEGQVQA
ncbi:MAG: ArsR/SmtB family transcription factor [Actinomycetales bacterium]